MQENTQTFYHILPNGLKIVHRRTPSPIAYIGVMVGAGTRDELPEENGMAHYIEHCVFKGTAHHSARQIISSIEGIGGEINAYTTKEEKSAGGISVRDIIWVNDALAAEYVNNGVFYDAKQNTDNATLLFNEIASGNSFIYILDRQQYEKLKKDGVFEPLSDVFGNKTLDCAIDEYGIDFKSTAFAKYFDCYKDWKGELVLCLRSDTLSESLINRLKGSQQYERAYKLHRQIFIDLVEFEVK